MVEDGQSEHGLIKQSSVCLLFLVFLHVIDSLPYLKVTTCSINKPEIRVGATCENTS